jgi:hypothetical protein
MLELVKTQQVNEKHLLVNADRLGRRIPVAFPGTATSRQANFAVSLPGRVEEGSVTAEPSHRSVLAGNFRPLEENFTSKLTEATGNDQNRATHSIPTTCLNSADSGLGFSIPPLFLDCNIGVSKRSQWVSLLLCLLARVSSVYGNSCFSTINVFSEN